MVRWFIALFIISGCKYKDEADAEESAQSTPKPCVIGDDVCMVFDSTWSSAEASDECSAYGGERGQCPEGKVGACTVDGGASFQLYNMNPVDAAAYCDYLGGEWVIES